MSKIKDVLSVLQKVDVLVKLYGAAENFMPWYVMRVQEIGKAIAKEHGVNPENAMKIPEETILGKDAEQAFVELKEWLRTKYEMLQDV